MDYIKKFSERLSDLLHEKEITQRKLASDTKISEQAISHWILRTRSPQLPYLWILADYFGCTVDYLIGRSEF